MIEHVAYVRHHDVADFYEVGWTISSFFDGPENHGTYSVIMQWPGRGEPRRPLQNKPNRDNAIDGLPVEGGHFHTALSRIPAG
jgi:hypothetical protein